MSKRSSVLHLGLKRLDLTFVIDFDLTFLYHLLDVLVGAFTLLELMLHHLVLCLHSLHQLLLLTKLFHPGSVLTVSIGFVLFGFTHLLLSPSSLTSNFLQDINW